MNYKPFLIGAGILGAGAAGYALHDTVKPHLDYAGYLIPHKYHVYRAMREMGYPITRALAHDLSKLRPSEWGPYVEWRNGPKGLLGTKDPEVFHRFRMAVRKHYHRNPGHHWAVLGKHPWEVSTEDQAERMADWYGVRKTKKPKEIPNTFRQWYKETIKDNPRMPLTQQAREEINQRLKLASLGFKKSNSYIRTKLREI